MKNTNKLTWILGLILFAIIGGVMNSNKGSGEASQPKPQPSPEQLAETKKADNEISNAVLALRHIKNGMKNPKSFDLDTFLIFPGGSTCYEYHATNSFNAIVPGKAVLDAKKGRVFVSDGDKNKLIKSWNEICTKTGGRELASVVKKLS